MDFALTKLRIDQLVDPSMDVSATLAKINFMVADIRQMVTTTATPGQRLEALRAYLFESGSWNQYRPFRYDFNDPPGTYIPNKLLHNYLARRLGNCVSMPFLFLAIGQKLGLTLTATIVPKHILVKYRDADGEWHNIETTSGGHFRRQILYEKEHQLTPESIRSGLYLRAMSCRDTVVLMSTVLMDHLAENLPHLPEQLAELAELAIRHDPLSLGGLMNRANALNAILRRDFATRYQRPRDIPVELLPRYRHIDSELRAIHARIDSLGWEEQTPEQARAYIEVIRSARNPHN